MQNSNKMKGKDKFKMSNKINSNNNNKNKNNKNKDNKKTTTPYTSHTESNYTKC